MIGPGPQRGAIWAHTVGYAHSLRGNIPLAFLKAFIDDSSAESSDRRLFLAGYLNTAEKWERFERAWEEELKTPPSIDYLKMVEAQNLRDQFRGWLDADRDEKLRGLARVICHFEPFSFQFSINRSRYYELVTPTAPRGFGNPHFIGSFGIVSGLARFISSQKIKTPIDFIFDQQDGVSGDVNLFFEYMMEALPRATRRLITRTPIFRDDKEFVPLQAADMLAWHLRREHEYGALAMATLLRCEKGHLVSELPETVMQSWSNQIDRLPVLDQFKSKDQWRTIKREIVRFQSLGFVPPYGSWWKNMVFRLRELFGA